MVSASFLVLFSLIHGAAGDVACGADDSCQPSVDGADVNLLQTRLDVQATDPCRDTCTPEGYEPCTGPQDASREECAECATCEEGNALVQQDTQIDTNENAQQANIYGLPSGSNQAAPAGYTPKSGSGACRCRGSGNGLDSCGSLCCSASPYTDPDPSGTYPASSAASLCFEPASFTKLSYPNVNCPAGTTEATSAQCQSLPGMTWISTLNGDSNWINGCFEWYSSHNGQNENTRRVYYNNRAGATTGNYGGNKICVPAAPISCTANDAQSGNSDTFLSRILSCGSYINACNFASNRIVYANTDYPGEDDLVRGENYIVQWDTASGCYETIIAGKANWGSFGDGNFDCMGICGIGCTGLPGGAKDCLKHDACAAHKRFQNGGSGGYCDDPDCGDEGAQAIFNCGWSECTQHGSEGEWSAAEYGGELGLGLGLDEGNCRQFEGWCRGQGLNQARRRWGWETHRRRRSCPGT